MRVLTIVAEVVGKGKTKTGKEFYVGQCGQEVLKIFCQEQLKQGKSYIFYGVLSDTVFFVKQVEVEL